MNDITQAIGELAQGALTARAVEPTAGDGATGGQTGRDGHTHESACLNCGTALVGTHCHTCGQHAHVHKTLGAFFHDLLHGVLHFEGKLWRTLPLLTWRPGRLTREYIDGRRASYVSPIALFLFTIFVTFALWSALGGIGEINDINTNIKAPTAGQFAAGVAGIDNDIVKLEADLRKPDNTPQEIASIQRQLESARKARRLMAAVVEDTGGTTGKAGAARAGQATAAEQGLRHWLESAWDKARADPALTVYKLQTNSYKLSWLLIPLSLPFMWLLFPFSRRFRMYDHTVFVTYSISFMTMLIALASVGGYFGVTLLVVVPLLYAPLHLYRQLRGAYALSRFSAIWRMLALSATIYVVLGLFLTIMLAMVIGH